MNSSREHRLFLRTTPRLKARLGIRSRYSMNGPKVAYQSLDRYIEKHTIETLD